LAASDSAPQVSGLSMERWRLNPAIRLSWRDWGAESVVIEVRSGQTLVFDPLSAAVMACIEAGAADIDTLMAAICADLGDVEPATLTDTLCTALERLNKLGWIEPIALATG